MSATSLVNDKNSYLWRMLRDSGGDQRLEKFARSIQLGNTIMPIHAAHEDLALLGMAMRYVLMDLFGAVDYHPMSSSNREPFGEILNSFGDKRGYGFIVLALLDQKARGGTLDRFWLEIQEQLMKKDRGVRGLHIDEIWEKHRRFVQFAEDLKVLYLRTLRHYEQPLYTGLAAPCGACNTIQRPGDIWLCHQCGYPLTHKTGQVTSLSLLREPTRYDNLIPTFAGAVGGADLPVAIDWHMFSVRTVKQPYVQVNHLLMCWLWWALYSEDECPPLKTFTIYYARQASEVTVGFRALHNLLGLNLEALHDQWLDKAEFRLNPRSETLDDYDVFDLF